MSFNFASQAFTDGDPIVHWRTTGSKNGVRLWQNKDGSYTEAGRNSKPGGRYNSRYDAAKAKVVAFKDKVDTAVTNKRAYGTGLYAKNIQRQKGSLRQPVIYADDVAYAVTDLIRGDMTPSEGCKVALKYIATCGALTIGLAAVTAIGYTGYENLMGKFVQAVYDTTGKSGSFGGMALGFEGEVVEPYSKEDILNTLKAEFTKATDKTKEYVNNLPQAAKEAWVEAKINATTIIPSAKQALDKLVGSVGLAGDAIREGVTQGTEYFRNKVSDLVDNVKGTTDGVTAVEGTLENIDGSPLGSTNGRLGLPGTIDLLARNPDAVNDDTPITDWINSAGKRIYTAEDDAYNSRSIIDKAKDAYESAKETASDKYDSVTAAMEKKAHDGTDSGKLFKNLMTALGLGDLIGNKKSGKDFFSSFTVDLSGVEDAWAPYTDPKGWAEAGGSFDGYKVYKEAKKASEKQMLQSLKQQYANYAAEQGDFGSDGRGIFAEDISDDTMKDMLTENLGASGYSNLLDYWFHNAASS